MSDVLRVLTEARELISDESRWTQAEMARDDVGDGVPAEAANAVCWCAAGAVCKTGATINIGWDACRALHDAAKTVSGGKFTSAGDLNDRTDHAAVLAMFDAAIATEQAKAGAAS